MHLSHTVVQVMHQHGKKHVLVSNTSTATEISCYASANRAADNCLISEIKQQLDQSCHSVDVVPTEDADISIIMIKLFDASVAD